MRWFGGCCTLLLSAIRRDGLVLPRTHASSGWLKAALLANVLPAFSSLRVSHAFSAPLKAECENVAKGLQEPDAWEPKTKTPLSLMALMHLLPVAVSWRKAGFHRRRGFLLHLERSEEDLRCLEGPHAPLRSEMSQAQC